MRTGKNYWHLYIISFYLLPNVIEVNCAISLTSSDYQFLCFSFLFFFCSDAYVPQSHAQRRRTLIKVHVRSSGKLHFDDNFADTREIAELEDHDNSNSEGNWFAISFTK